MQGRHKELNALKYVPIQNSIGANYEWATLSLFGLSEWTQVFKFLNW